MSAKGGANKVDPEPDPSNIDQRELSTNQEATALPMFAGEAKIALRWISPIMGQYAKEAPAERPGKK